MKKILIIGLIALNLNTFGQESLQSAHFNSLSEVSGTEYVIASVEQWENRLVINSKYFLFINTITGETNQIDFPKNSILLEQEQIRIDSLDINVIVVSGKTSDMNGNKLIDLNDPTQIMILSADGEKKTQLTDHTFYTTKWHVNRFTGTIVITGYYDLNANGRFDNKDKNEILIFDLKTLRLISKI